jgi:hypothetical protein
MAVYNSAISRSDADALIPEQVSQEIIKHVPQQSVFLRMARRLPNMSAKKTRMPVLGSLVSAYFVAGDTGLKQTTKASWENKYIEAEELAAIVPIPESVLDDADYDVWGELRPLLIEALGVAIDQAVFYGTNAPSSWPTGIVTAATAAGHVVTLGTGAVGSGFAGKSSSRPRRPKPPRKPSPSRCQGQVPARRLRGCQWALRAWWRPVSVSWRGWSADLGRQPVEPHGRVEQHRQRG